MSFADDLLEQAYHLAKLESDEPKQACLRRAVSTAYYALFHLLIDEAVGNWGIARQRSILARTFDHGKMKSICEDHVRYFYSSGQPESGAQLKNVAQTFVQLQEKRHTADYDNAFVWSRTNAVAAIDMAAGAFSDWGSIRAQEAAQDYLLQLFLPKIPRV
jgi:uncharacterized protein (UPF0332 family)